MTQGVLLIISTVSVYQYTADSVAFSGSVHLLGPEMYLSLIKIITEYLGFIIIALMNEEIYP